MSQGATAIGVHRVTGTIGAEITGVRVGPDLPGEAMKTIRDVLLEHKVVFFRGQHHLDDEAQARFAQLFGELSAGRKAAPGEDPESYITDVDSRYARASNWHTDSTCSDRPHAMTFLRALQLPSYGGDTAWANTVAAYQGMPDELRELADGLRVLHSNTMVTGKRHRALVASGLASGPEPEMKGPRRNLSEAEHPVVRVHPETAERAFVLGRFAKSIAGRSESESRQLIDTFQGFVTRIDNTVRWHWALGDLAVWDNRATQHCAISDYGAQQRLLHRVTIQGDVPVGVDGRPSVALMQAPRPSAA
jgi:alpha-ketoglutarate-dependent sulfate ester dioxygenase